MSHSNWAKIPEGAFVQKGIGFDDIADIGLIIESYRLFEEVVADNSYQFKRISSYHLDYDWLTFSVGEKRFVVAVSQGAPMVVDLAERFLSSGVKKIIRIGTAGTLLPEMHLGEVIVPYAAIRDEGTSAFYLSQKAPALADVDFSTLISHSLQKNEMKVYNGILWSTDGRWKETDDVVLLHKADGAIATDMESAALFAFGLNRNCSVASVSLLSDEIYADEGKDVKGMSDKEIWFKKVLPAFNKIFEVLTKNV